MQTQLIEYQDGDVTLEALIAWDDQQPGIRPAVLAFSDWTGRNHFVDQKAQELAELGYVGIAIDMYGKGKIGHNNEEKTALMMPLRENRALLRQRVLAGFEMAKKIEVVDPNKIGAMGFCFGGLCALDLARTGADLSGIVTFHASLEGPKNLPQHKIQCPLLILHGYDDPMVPPDQVAAFEQEMTAAGVDWQLHTFSQTMHSFTNPEANDPAFGTVYNSRTNKRAWIAMKNFWEEVFG